MGPSQACCLLLLLLFLTHGDGSVPCFDPNLACVERSECNLVGSLPFRECPRPSQVCCIGIYVIPRIPVPPPTLSPSFPCIDIGLTCVERDQCDLAGSLPFRSCPLPSQACCIDDFVTRPPITAACSFTGLTCVSEGLCSVNGILPLLSCPFDQECCVGELVITTTTTTTLPPCTGPDIACVTTCSTVSLPGDCPDSLTCCLDPFG